MKKMKILISVLIVSALLFSSPYAFGVNTQTSLQNPAMTDSEIIEEDSGRITLELKGMDILDVLKILAKKSGLNIVAGKNVGGR